jgi:hypothetical protein
MLRAGGGIGFRSVGPVVMVENVEGSSPRPSSVFSWPSYFGSRAVERQLAPGSVVDVDRAFLTRRNR